MATASKIGPQDLPPAGGYANIRTERIKLRSLIGWKTGIAFFLFTHITGALTYSRVYRAVRRDMVEMRSARFALEPLLTAERDRAFLKQLRKNRDEEADLMKDYPGWEVGTYFGERVYNSFDDDALFEPLFVEYTVHAPPEGTYLTRWMHRHYI